MAPLNTTRTLFEVRVGAYHTIEVMLQIRQSDITWWKKDLRNHERQLHKLLGRRVLPVECREEIEEFHTKRRERELHKLGGNESQKDGKKKKKVVAGEDNLKKKSKRKRGKNSTKDDSKKGDAKSRKKQKNSKGADESNKEKRAKPFQDPGTWIIASGYTIQLCYYVDDIETSSATTMVFRPKKSNTDVSKTEETVDDNVKQSAKTEQHTQTSLDDEGNKKVPLASFRKWTKLKKRINVWVFNVDPNNPCDLSQTEGGGFPRPDLLPMADIFRTLGNYE